MARGKAGQKDDGGITKMEAVRQALAELGKDATPQAIGDFVKTQYGHTMTVGLIYNYKSHLSKRKGKGRRKSKGVPAAEGSAPATKARGAAGVFHLEDFQAVKELADRIGPEKVRDLAKVLAK